MIRYNELTDLLQCPQCGGGLEHLPSDSFICQECRRRYPSFVGIPDFRLHYSLEQSLASEQESLEEYGLLFDEMSFDELYGYHFERIMALGERPPEILADAKATYYRGEERETRRLGNLKHWLAHDGRTSLGEIGLEVGCGVGFSFPVWARECEILIAVDIRMQELLFARKLLEERGIDNVILVCGGEECLPIQEDIVDFVYFTGVIEHVNDPYQVLKDVQRVLVSSGFCWFDCDNRYAPWEHHVHLYGVGYMPRVLQPLYVRLLRDDEYQGIELLSYWEINRLLRSTGWDDYRIITSSVADQVIPPHPRSRRAYLTRWLRMHVSWLYPLLHLWEKLLLPSFDVLAYKGLGDES